MTATSQAADQVERDMRDAMFAQAEDTALGGRGLGGASSTALRRKSVAAPSTSGLLSPSRAAARSPIGHVMSAPWRTR